jgi:ABC-type protease/lipase transport system fused ATPase/permease subunit
MVMKQMKRTVFVISHRLNILSAVNKMMMIANGTVQLYGPRDEVMEVLRKRAEVVATGKAQENKEGDSEEWKQRQTGQV